MIAVICCRTRASSFPPAPKVTYKSENNTYNILLVYIIYFTYNAIRLKRDITWGEAHSISSYLVCLLILKNLITLCTLYKVSCQD